MKIIALNSKPFALSVVLALTSPLTACGDDKSNGLPDAGQSSGGDDAGAEGGSGGQQTGGGGTGGSDAGGLAPFEERVLFEFDFTDTGTYDWAASAEDFCASGPNGGSLELIEEDRDPNNPTPGALRFNAQFPPFSEFGESCVVHAIFAYGDATTGTIDELNGGTMLHFWLRLASTPRPAPGLEFLQPFIQGGALSNFGNVFGYTAGADITDGEWHEYVIDLSASYDVAIGVTPFMADVWRLGLFLNPNPAPAALIQPGPDAGLDAGVDAGTPAVDAGASDAGAPLGPAPDPLVIDIDYIWIE